ncbi:tyrosine-protein phosphatase [Microbacterium excoecariae]|uniref:tyrosine-protein phosphatase n=1 Tax=Microbacterium excoecariae TaxID=2715210 RepID=UPI0014075926|nr:tyrosine-protein phosphatase [Microbacterium excoecariae]NHI15972.1 tyrosine-protein phosphatase [Microbacterium excoecariae]
MSIDVLDLPLSAPVNLRDLGGIPMAGGTVRTGFAIRTDDLATVDPATAADLVDGGLAAVIDLRSHQETAFTGRGALAEQPVTYHHLPFMASVGDAGSSAEAFDQASFGQMYIRMYEQAAPRIVASLAVIATAPGATAFHCAAGQDRTGVLAASLLLALGAPHEAIVADYARTGENSPRIMQRLAPVMGPIMAQHGYDLTDAAKAATRAEFSPEPMRQLLAHLENGYADPLVPLREAGLTDGLVATLRERARA